VRCGPTPYTENVSRTEPLSSMGKPSTPTPPPDPMLGQLMQTAQQQQVQALQSEAAGDTASLMARYGARLAAGGPVGTMPLGLNGAGR
jgi:hypothetical protein